MAQQPVSSLFVFYTVARFVIFGAFALLLWWIGLKGWTGLLVAAAISIPVSYFALRPLRDRLTGRISERQRSRLEAKEEFRTAGTEDDKA